MRDVWAERTIIQGRQNMEKQESKGWTVYGEVLTTKGTNTRHRMYTQHLIQWQAYSKSFINGSQKY